MFLCILKQFPQLYGEYSEGKEWDPGLQGFLESVRKRITDDGDRYSLDEDTLARLSELPDILKDESNRCRELIREKQKLNSREEEINNYLAVEVEDEQIKDLHRRLSENSYRIGQAESGYEIIGREYEELQNGLEVLRRNRKQILENVVKEQEEYDENLRIVTYAQMQIELMENYRKKLQALKADDLAEQMTECFQKIIAKKGLIQKIRIDHETLEFSYFNKNGQKVDHQMLSSGEKQILVIAMLWALGICSKAEFPLIIDTPLARLDSVHRTSLIENYFPKASDQVIILSTDQEITEKDYRELKKYVGREYTLVYDVETMSSSIRPGYFGGNRT